MVHVVIVGAGFAGIRCALDLAQRQLGDVKITLISPSSHFEYHAALYRVLFGKTPMEVCIPLSSIFEKKRVGFVEDYVVNVDRRKNIVIGRSGSKYKYDYLVIAIGSEINYYNIPGLDHLSFSFKSINDALRLKRHIHEVFESCKLSDERGRVFDTRFVVIGGGATGVEIAGALAVYTRKVAKMHDVDPSMISIDLITSSNRLVPELDTHLSTMVENRLRDLSVHVFLGRTVMKEEVEEVFLRDMTLKTRTVIWAAGTKGNHLYESWGFSVDKKGRAIVNHSLQAENMGNIFVLGDGTTAEHSGMADTAIYHGEYVADAIARRIRDLSVNPIMTIVPKIAIPVGPSWAIAKIGSFHETGYLGWIVRRLFDLQFFLSILPVRQAVEAFREEGKVWESCRVCLEAQQRFSLVK